MQQVARLAIQYRRGLLWIALAATAALLPLSRGITVDRSVHSFFDPDDPLVLDYNRVQAEFGGDTMCLAAYTDAELMTPAGMQRLREFRDRLAQVRGVLSATCLADMRRPGDPNVFKTLRDWFGEKRIAPDRLRDEILDCDMYVDQFVGRDGRTAAVAMLIDPVDMGSGAFTQGLAQLRSAAAEHPFETHIVGAPAMINDVYDYLDEDSFVLTYVSSLAMMLVILVLFRSPRWVLLPGLLVGICLVWTRAVMAVSGIQLSITNSMTTAMVTVIGIATSIHIAVRFREEMGGEGKSFDPLVARAALERTFVKVFPAVFWTCATTAIGFGALGISRVAPVRDFGLVMAAAALFVFVAAIMVIPGGVLLGRWRSIPNAAPGEASLALGLGRVADFVSHHAGLAWLAAGLLLAVAFWGLRFTQVETDFTRNFRGNSTILRGYRFVEDRLGGAGFVEIAFDAPETLTQEFLDQVRDCEDQLRKIPGVTKVSGLTDLLDLINQSLGATSSATWMLPLQLEALRRQQPAELAQLWNKELHRMRLVLRVLEQQTTDGKRFLLDEINATARRYLGPDMQVTGLYVLLVYTIDSLLRDQWTAFFISALGVWLMLTCAFRSPRLGLVGFLPNLIPIAIVIGFMGWIGWKINVATAMIYSVSMGLAVDFSIHYLNRFQQERRGGADLFAALTRTHRSTGKAMVFASVALMLGFGVLTFSNLLPTAHFGLLVSLAMFGGLVGNLVMLPALLRIGTFVPSAAASTAIPPVSQTSSEVSP